MIRVYIAGPYTAPTPEEIDANIDAAEKVVAQIIGSSERFAVLCPHSLGRNFKDGPGSPDYWYRATMAMAQDCDVCVTVPGWERSRGSVAEVAWFAKHRRTVYDSAAELLLELGRE